MLLTFTIIWGTLLNYYAEQDGMVPHGTVQLFYELDGSFWTKYLLTSQSEDTCGIHVTMSFLSKESMLHVEIVSLSCSCATSYLKKKRFSENVISIMQAKHSDQSAHLKILKSYKSFTSWKPVTRQQICCL